jgi:hypothetical protein
MTSLNITFEIIAAYKAYTKAISVLENSNEVKAYSSKGMKKIAKYGNKTQRMAVTATHKKFISAVVEAGNTGDWDVEKISAKLDSQPEGIAYTFA